MAIDYVYKPDRRLVIVVWDGTIKTGQWRKHLIRIFADANFRRAEMQLTDLRSSIIDPAVTNNTILRAVSFLAGQREHISQKKLAIVAGADWEKPKLVERLIEPLQVRPIVFTNLMTACAWLDLDVIETGREIQQLRLKLRSNSAAQ
jgi:hypothetical protein